MSRQLAAVLLIALSMIAAGALSLQNTAVATANLFGFTTDVTTGTAILVGYALAAIGFGGGGLLVLTGRRRQTKQLEAWQAQDAKLMQELQSDRERQLEAKVATLEAALDRAIKKKT